MNSIMSKKRKPVLTFVLIFVLCFAMSTAAFAAIRLNRTHLDCAAGAPRRLKAEGTSAKVTWRSSNTARATVNSQGYVKGIRRGSLTVTAKIGSTTKKCTVTVLSDRDVALRVYGRVKQKYPSATVLERYRRGNTLYMWIARPQGDGAPGMTLQVNLISGKVTCQGGWEEFFSKVPRTFSIFYDKK